MKKNNELDLNCGPILLTCYTNHALDQFVGHIQEYTNNIVRLGGRCSEEFNKYKINEVAKVKTMNLGQSYYTKKEELEALGKDYRTEAESFVYTTNILPLNDMLIMKNEKYIS